MTLAIHSGAKQSFSLEKSPLGWMESFPEGYQGSE
jgi:hypothetical protein